MSVNIDVPGTRFKLGYRIPEVRRFSAVPSFSEKNQRIEPKDWTEIDLTPWRTQKYEQQHNDCAGNGKAVTAGALWYALTGQKLKFCAGWIYAHANGDRDEGAMVRDVVQASRTVGLATQDIAGEHKIYKRDYTRAIAAEAGLRLMGEAYQCEDWVDIGSALMQGFFVDFGVMIDRAFMEGTGSDGICPQRINLGQIVGGHAMGGFGLKRINGAMRLVVNQSWPQWGTPEKWGYMSEDYFAPMLRHPQYGEMVNLDAYACRTFVDKTKDTPPPVLMP